MITSGRHQQHASEGLTERDERPNRFLHPHGDSPLGIGLLRERAASQPPRTTAAHSPVLPSPAHRVSPSADDRRASPWAPRTSSSLNPHSPLVIGMPQSVPTRSTSFSGASPGAAAYTPTSQHGFASTFEDDEFDVSGADAYEHTGYRDQDRGRSYGVDITKSRSQSLAAPLRQAPIGSPFRAWDESPTTLHMPRYAGAGASEDLRPPGPSRYGSLGAASFARSPPAGGRPDDVSNISPFVRDVGQILLDDGSAFRELWAGMHPPRDEPHAGAGPGSGTTSRRHSVSVVQPRREIIGFAADDPADERPAYGFGSGRRGGFADDELAADLSALSLSQGPGGAYGGGSGHARHPSGEPLRSPPAAERMSYQALKLQMPGSAGSPFNVAVGSPARDGGAGGSPSVRGFHEPRAAEAPYLGATAGRAAAQALGARYVPGHGIQYPGAGTDALGSPGGFRSPLAGGAFSPGRAHMAPQMARRASDAAVAAPGLPLAEMGRGVPLSAVPPSWPLFIVEFKAGRTDLFYCTNSTLDIRAGDLVIVEADRGKDLGHVLNDTITLAEVESFQQQQQARAGWTADGQGGPTSKEISPKMIYGKASMNDAQYVAVCALACMLLTVPQGAHEQDPRGGKGARAMPSEGPPKEAPDGGHRCRIPMVRPALAQLKHGADATQGPAQTHVLLHRGEEDRLPRARSRAL
jgi:hypothetical protein